MKNLNNKHKQGFTLLELMLVIAIIAAILVLGLSAYEQKLKNGRIETTAVEMQTWLQASLRFYVDYSTNGIWPQATVAPNRYATQIITHQYMKEYQLTNPWEQNFEIKPIPDPSTGLPTKSIEITTTVPRTLNKYTATMIAARVPFAKKPDDTDMYEVVLDMPLPAIITKQQDKIIETVGTIIIDDPNNPPNVEAPDCPVNYQPEIHVAVQKIEVHPIGAPPVLQSFDAYAGDLLPGNPKYWKPHLDIKNGQDKIVGVGRLMVITMCVKNNTTTAKNNFIRNTNYLF